MRRYISLFLALVLIFFLSVPVSASDRKKVNLLNPDEETIFNQMLEQLPSDQTYLIKESTCNYNNLVALSAKSLDTSTHSVIVDDGGGSSTATKFYYPTLTMPGAMFYIVTKGWKSGSYSTDTYGQYECFKFTENGITVLVKKTAFYPSDSGNYDYSGRYPSSDTIISDNVTQYINTGNTNFYYSGRWRVYKVEGQCYVQLAVYGTQAFKYEEDEIVLQHKIIASAGYAALINTSSPKTPTLKLAITNTGTGRRYTGGYYFKGAGSNTTTINAGSLIEVGYKAFKVASAAVSSLTFSNVKSLFDSAVSLTKTGGTIKSYLSETIPISNTSRNIYTYSCKLKCPYPMEHNGDYFQIHIGLNGEDGTSLTYKVTFAN